MADALTPTSTPQSATALSFDHIPGHQVEENLVTGEGMMEHAQEQARQAIPQPVRVRSAAEPIDMEKYEADVAARNAAKDQLYQEKPDEFKKQHPVEYVTRRLHDTLEDAIVSPAVEGLPSGMREKIEPKVRDLAETGMSLYGVPPGKRDEPVVMAQGVVPPEGGELEEETLNFNKIPGHKTESPAVPENGNPKIVASAQRYNAAQGQPPIVHEPLPLGTTEERNAMADAYDAMTHSPDDPRVKAAYQAMKNETKAQFEHMTKDMGIKVDFTPHDPYKTAAEMQADVRNNNHLSVFTGGESQANHPASEIDKDTGQSYQNLFRATHDIFGHAAGGFDFSEQGENSAYGAHMQMYSPEARPAVQHETQGQANWFFNNAQVREGKPLGDFPPQKATVLPENFGRPSEEAIRPIMDSAAVFGDQPFSSNSMKLYTNIDDQKEVTKTLDYLTKTGQLEKVGPIHYRLPLADQIAKVHEKEGGSTFGLQTGNLAGTDRFAVAAYPDREEIVTGTLTPQRIQEFITKNADLLKNSENSVGTWKNPQGKHILDISHTPASREEAINVAKKNNQQAIFDLKEGEEISIGGAGGATGYHPDLQKIADKYPTTEDASKVKQGASFIAPDGKFINLPADHPTIMAAAGVGDKTADDARIGFINDTGAIRVRFSKDRAGDTLHISVPPGKVTPEQVDAMKQAVAKVGRYGNLVMETAVNPPNIKTATQEFATPAHVDEMLEKIEASPKGDGTSFHFGANVPGLPDEYKQKISQLRTTHGPDAAYAEVAKYLTPVERKQAGSVLKNNVLDAFANLPHEQDFEESAKAGAIQKGWYRNTAKTLKGIFGQEAPLFSNIAAALSPLKPVRENFRDALDFYADWVSAGRPTSGRKLDNLTTNRYMGAYAQNLQRAVRGEEISGAKVSNFAKNLQGNLQAITKDRWMAFFNGDPNGSWTKGKRQAMDVAMRRTAEKLGWEPAEVQETIWSLVKTVVESSEKEGISPSEKARNLTDAEIRAGAGSFRDLIEDPKIADAFERIAKVTGDKRFSPAAVQSSRGYRASQRSTPKVTGQSVSGATDVLGRVGERAKAAARTPNERGTQALGK